MGIEDKLHAAAHQLGRVESYLNKQRRMEPGNKPVYQAIQIVMYVQAAVNAEHEALRIVRTFNTTGRIG